MAQVASPSRAQELRLFAGLAVQPFVAAALPVVVWRMRRGPPTLRQVLLGGALLGNLPFAVIVPLAAAAGGSGAGWFWPFGAIRALAVGAVFGVAGAAVFWAIAVRGTGPDTGRWD
jgi:hypothetical protein